MNQGRITTLQAKKKKYLIKPNYKTEEKNYNPMKHCEQHNQIKNQGKIYSIKI